MAAAGRFRSSRSDCCDWLMFSFYFFYLTALCGTVVISLQQSNRCPIPVQSPHIYILLTRANAHGPSTFGKPRIHQGAKIFVPSLGSAPQRVELMKHISRHLDCSPYPAGPRVVLLHLNL